MKLHKAAAWVTVLLLCFLCGCTPVSGGAQSAGQPSVSSGEEGSSKEESQTPTHAQELVSKMTLEEKVGQLFFLCFRKDASRNDIQQLDEPSLSALHTIRPGGVVLFGENISTVEGVRNWIASAQQTAEIPLFVSVDQEGGAVQRIRHTEAIPATDLPDMYEVGMTGNSSYALAVGQVIGKELSVFGFNMDFAPTCDVFSNPQNTVIGRRAFSGDPQVVADCSVQLGKGLEENGIIPVAKHFPGHGDTAEDSHDGYAVSQKSLEQLKETELIPFRAQIEAGVPFIMAAHISLPAVSSDNTPASLSEPVLTGLLRETLGYDGVIITDALDMGAIVQNYGTEQACVQALKAGADMLLMPADPQAGFNAVLEAVRNGEISEERLNASVERILETKEKYGLFEPSAPTDPSVLGCEEHQAVVQDIKEQAENR